MHVSEIDRSPLCKWKGPWKSDENFNPKNILLIILISKFLFYPKCKCGLGFQIKEQTLLLLCLPGRPTLSSLMETQWVLTSAALREIHAAGEGPQMHPLECWNQWAQQPFLLYWERQRHFVFLMHANCIFRTEKKFLDLHSFRNAVVALGSQRETAWDKVGFLSLQRP